MLRILANRVCLGEMSFRGITATGCHPPITGQLYLPAVRAALMLEFRF